jgi:hypothetical protein
VLSLIRDASVAEPFDDAQNEALAKRHFRQALGEPKAGAT